MKKSKLFYLLLIPLFFYTSQSCTKTDNSGAEWKTENEAHIGKIKTNHDYKEATVPGGPGSVYYKVLKDSVGEIPLYTSTVNVRYKGTLIDGTVFDDASNRIVALSVSGVVPGFAVALQNMRVGDKWEVHIPWQLGYGTTPPSGSVILSYSALIFEIELVGISQY